MIDLDVSGTNIRKIHIEKLQVFFYLLSSIKTVTLFSHVLRGRMGTDDDQTITKMDWFVSLESCSCS